MLLQNARYASGEIAVISLEGVVPFGIVNGLVYKLATAAYGKCGAPLRCFAIRQQKLSLSFLPDADASPNSLTTVILDGLVDT